MLALTFISAATMTAARPTTPRRRQNKTPPTPNASRSNAKSKPASKPRKRVRVSDLTLKYRRDCKDFDETLLIGDASAALFSTTHDASQTTASKPPTKRHSISTSPSQEGPPLPQVVRSHSVPRPALSSRFPQLWKDVISQTVDAVKAALSDGFDRIRIDLHHPHLIPSSQSHQLLPQSQSLASQQSSLQQTHQNPLLPDVSNIHIRSELAADLVLQLVASTACTLVRNFEPDGSIILFDNPEDYAAGASRVKSYLGDVNCETAVLGEMDSACYVGKLIVVITPSNRRGCPSRIEAVQHVHYSNFNRNNWVVIIDPDLIALTSFTTLTEEPRLPLFLADYIVAYHMNPLAFPSRTATGGMLRCYPRKWELYLRKINEETGFRLVSEQKKRPSREKVHCEFSWRVEREFRD